MQADLLCCNRLAIKEEQNQHFPTLPNTARLTH